MTDYQVSYPRSRVPSYVHGTPAVFTRKPIHLTPARSLSTNPKDETISGLPVIQDSAMRIQAQLTTSTRRRRRVRSIHAMGFS
jgi:hypothetical protein